MRNDTHIIPKEVDVPVALYESIKGRYFMGYVDNLAFGNNTSAIARLYNPCWSKMNLYVNVWTVTDISEIPYQAEFWFNANPPEELRTTDSVTPTNTTIEPSPKPMARLQYGSKVAGQPNGGIKAFIRNALPNTTLVESEDGKLIFPPGGSLLILLSAPQNIVNSTTGWVAFGWWEEPNCHKFN